jgi:hypothetical protein
MERGNTAGSYSRAMEWVRSAFNGRRRKPRLSVISRPGLRPIRLPGEDYDDFTDRMFAVAKRNAWR